MTEAEERQAPLQEKLRTGDPAGDREGGQCPWQRDWQRQKKWQETVRVTGRRATERR